MPNNEKNAEPAVRDAQSTAARRRRRRHTPHGDARHRNALGYSSAKSRK